MDEEIPQEENEEVLLQDEIQDQENLLEVVETQNVTMVADNDIVLAIEKQTEAIHIQFAVLIAVLLFIKLWGRKN